MERAYKIYQNGQVWSPWIYQTVWIFGKFRGHVWKFCWRARSCFPTTFSMQIFSVFLKIQTVIKSHPLMPGISSLAILIFLTCFFPFLAFLKLQPIILWKVGKMIATIEGLFPTLGTSHMIEIPIQGTTLVSLPWETFLPLSPSGWILYALHWLVSQLL